MSSHPSSIYTHSFEKKRKQYFSGHLLKTFLLKTTLVAKNIKIKLDFFKRFIKSAICGEDLHGCFMPYGGFAICHLLTDGDDYCKVATLHFEEEFCLS